MISGKPITDFLTAVNPKNIQDIIFSENPSIIKVISENGEQPAKAIMRKLILDMLDFFMLGRSMGVNQVEATIELIFEAYGTYKFDDWKLCFKNAKLGEYGTVYDRIDGNVIFSWFDQYLEQRFSEFEAYRAKENRVLNDLEKHDPVEMPDYIKELIVKKVVTKDEPKVLNNTDRQKIINRWMLEFDALWIAQGSCSGKRFIMQNNIKMDISEYLQYKAVDEQI